MLSERQRLSLQDILDNIDAIERHLNNLTARNFETFERNELVSDAVERCMTRISEAAIRIGKGANKIAPGPPWGEVRGLGNQLRHGYHNIQLTIIWEIITDDLAPLAQACRKALTDDAEAAEGDKGA